VALLGKVSTIAIRYSPDPHSLALWLSGSLALWLSGSGSDRSCLAVHAFRLKWKRLKKDGLVEEAQSGKLVRLPLPWHVVVVGYGGSDSYVPGQFHEKTLACSCHSRSMFKQAWFRW